MLGDDVLGVELGDDVLGDDVLGVLDELLLDERSLDEFGLDVSDDGERSRDASGLDDLFGVVLLDELFGVLPVDGVLCELRLDVLPRSVGEVEDELDDELDGDCDGERSASAWRVRSRSVERVPELDADGDVAELSAGGVVCGDCASAMPTTLSAADVKINDARFMKASPGFDSIEKGHRANERCQMQFPRNGTVWSSCKHRLRGKECERGNSNADTFLAKL